MVTLNPVTIYDNIERASKISKELPGMQCRIGGIIEGEREKTRISLRKLGKLKCSIYSEDSTYNKLLNIIRKFSIPEDFSFQINGVDYSLPNIQKSDKCLEVCNTATAIAKGTFQGSVAGATSGAFVSFAAYSLVGSLGTASTGTAISALKGAAALKATLAWLGGGTIAAGGFGVTGGIITLAGLFAIPTLLIAGVSLGAKSDKMLAEAESELAKLRLHEEEAKVAAEKVRQIRKFSELAISTLKEIDAISNDYFEKLKSLNNFDFSMLDDTQKENLYKSYRICEIINHFANIDIINSEGIFNDNFEESIKNIKNELLSITG